MSSTLQSHEQDSIAVEDPIVQPVSPTESSTVSPETPSLMAVVAPSSPSTSNTQPDTDEAAQSMATLPSELTHSSAASPDLPASAASFPSDLPASAASSPSDLPSPAIDTSALQTPDTMQTAQPLETRLSSLSLEEETRPHVYDSESQLYEEEEEDEEMIIPEPKMSPPSNIPELEHLQVINQDAQTTTQQVHAPDPINQFQINAEVYKVPLEEGEEAENDGSGFDYFPRVTPAEVAVAEALAGTRVLNSATKFGVATSAVEEAYTNLHSVTSISNSPLSKKLTITNRRASIGGRSRLPSTSAQGDSSDKDNQGRRLSVRRNSSAMSVAPGLQAIVNEGISLITYAPGVAGRIIPIKAATSGIPILSSKKKALEEAAAAASAATSAALAGKFDPVLKPDTSKNELNDSTMDQLHKYNLVEPDPRMSVNRAEPHLESILRGEMEDTRVENKKQVEEDSLKPGLRLTVITKNGFELQVNDKAHSYDDMKGVLPKGLGREVAAVGPNFPYHGKRSISKWLRQKYKMESRSLRSRSPSPPPKQEEVATAAEDHVYLVHTKREKEKTECISQYSKPIPLVRSHVMAPPQKQPAKKYRLLRELRARQEIALQADYLGTTAIPAKKFLIRHHQQRVLHGMETLKTSHHDSAFDHTGKDPMDVILQTHQPMIASLLAGELSQSLVPTFNVQKPSYETFSHLGKVGIHPVEELDESKFHQESCNVRVADPMQVLEKMKHKRKKACLYAHQTHRPQRPTLKPISVADKSEPKLHVKDLPLILTKRSIKYHI